MEEKRKGGMVGMERARMRRRNISELSAKIFCSMIRNSKGQIQSLDIERVFSNRKGVFLSFFGNCAAEFGALPGAGTQR